MDSIELDHLTPILKHDIDEKIIALRCILGNIIMS